MKVRERTAILGAGLCGLSAAYHLEAGNDSNYLILERNHEPGGLARTETFNGFSFDHSIHILYSRDAYAVDLICKKLLAENLRRQTRESYCYASGIYTQYPYQVNNYGLPPEVIADNILGLVGAVFSPKQGPPPPDFESWIYATYGRGIADNFMVPYNRRVWAWDLKDMNYDWIADRVPVPAIREVLLGALRPPEKKFGPNHEFWYPLEGGIESLPRAFQRHIPTEKLWLNTSAAAIDSVRREVHLGDGRRLPYGRVISTLPMPTLVKLLGDSAPPEIRRAATGLKHNVVHTVNIGLEGADLGVNQAVHWVYFPEEATNFHRISFPSNFSASMAPEGCASIQVEISESIFRPRDRSALIRETLAGLIHAGVLSEQEARPVADGGRVRLANILTLDPAYIIYDLKHRENTQAIQHYLNGIDIGSYGRFGSWEYLNMDHSILQGKAAAEWVLGHDASAFG